MNAFLKTLLSMSLAGTALMLLVLALRPLLRRRTTRTFQYYLWLLVLLRLMLPLSLGLGLLPMAFHAAPELPDMTIEQFLTVRTPAPAAELTSSPPAPDSGLALAPDAKDTLTQKASDGAPAVSAGIAPDESDGSAQSGAETAVVPAAASVPNEAYLPAVFSASYWTLSRAVSALWVIGVCFYMLATLLGYRRLTSALKLTSHPAAPGEQALLASMTDRPVALRRSAACVTPMLMGLRRPAILLPEQTYDESRLRDILLHELTHLRRQDLQYKWLTALVCAVHWFNPLMPLLRQEINRACELACDEAVIRNMETPARVCYGETLLAVAADARQPFGVIRATMCEEKRTMRERMAAIGVHQNRTRRMVMLAAAALAIVLLAAAALGVFTPGKDADRSDWLAALCGGTETGDDARSALLVRFEAYLAEHSNDFTSEDISAHYDRAELTAGSDGEASLVLYYRDPTGLTIADRLSCDGADAPVRRGRSTVEDAESSPSSREIHVIHDAGYAYGYYVVTLEKWPSDGGTASNIRVYDAKTQRAKILVSTENGFDEVAWDEEKAASAAVPFTVRTGDGQEATFRFYPATMEVTTADGCGLSGYGGMMQMEKLHELEATQVKSYSDLRGGICDSPLRILKKDEYDPTQIVTFTFNAGTTFTGHEAEAEAVMEAGKNPGLGVRALHDEGVTGEGVNVAIIDQNLLLDHPEFAGKIAAYYDTGCGQPEDSGSMHGPAVTSLLVGENIGVAPGAKVYYAASPSWTYDSAYEAEGLRWIIAQNTALPEGEKIRVVSVSGAPSGPGSLCANQDQWDAAVAEAQAAGILVLDCRTVADTGFIWPAFYDPAQPEDVTGMTSGFASSAGRFTPNTWAIYVPTSYRTVAEEYDKGICSYQYTGSGGRSWGIPYAAGVLALGWQIDPSMTAEEAVNLLRESCYQNENGIHFIDPPAFIDAVRAQLPD